MASTGLTGTTALITGSTSGIGRAAALMLARRGAHVLVSGRDTARGDLSLLTRCHPPAPLASEFEGHAEGRAEVGYAGAEAGRRVGAEDGILALLAGGGEGGVMDRRHPGRPELLDVVG